MSDAPGRLWIHPADFQADYIEECLGPYEEEPYDSERFFQYVRNDAEAMEAAGWCSLANAQAIEREQTAKIEALSQQLQEAQKLNGQMYDALCAATDKPESLINGVAARDWLKERGLIQETSDE